MISLEQMKKEEKHRRDMIDGINMVGRVIGTVSAGQYLNKDYNEKERKGQLRTYTNIPDENHNIMKRCIIYNPSKKGAKDNLGTNRNFDIKLDKNSDLVDVTADADNRKLLIKNIKTGRTRKFNYENISEAVDVVRKIIGVVDTFKGNLI